MPTYQKAPAEIHELATELLEEYRDAHDKMYGHILDSNLKIDLMLAFADVDDKTGQPRNDAITHQGIRALGLCKIIGKKERAAGLGDVRILLDGDEWPRMSDVEQRSLLDHELQHIMVRSRDGAYLRDDLNRPLLSMRKHDIHVGMFSVVAARHGHHGIERRDFRKMVDAYGQYLMPEMFGEDTASSTLLSAARQFRNSIPDGTKVTIRSGDAEATIDKS